MRTYRSYSLRTEDNLLGELYKECDTLDRRIEKREEKVLLVEGCYGCGGEIGVGSQRLSITLTGPCSVGQVHQTYIICSDCNSKIWDIVNNRGGIMADTSVEVGHEINIRVEMVDGGCQFFVPERFLNQGTIQATFHKTGRGGVVITLDGDSMMPGQSGIDGLPVYLSVEGGE
jgi:hypothetical protein